MNASKHNAMMITITQLASSLRAVKRLFVLTYFGLSIALNPVKILAWRE